MIRRSLSRLCLCALLGHIVACSAADNSEDSGTAIADISAVDIPADTAIEETRRQETGGDGFLPDTVPWPEVQDGLTDEISDAFPDSIDLIAEGVEEMLQWETDDVTDAETQDTTETTALPDLVELVTFPFEPCGLPAGNGADNIPMCLVPGSTFPMGSPAGECEPWGEDCSNEHPQHDVFVSAFLIDQAEIRTKQFAACVAAGGCTEPEEKTPTCNYGKEEMGEHPINCVDWFGLNAYCAWVGKRLCTEAEWEKAATGEEHHLYPWGDEWVDGNGNCPPSACNDGFDLTAPVGSFPWAASPYGLLDMDANVMEFTSDWYKAGYYSSSPSEDPKGPCPGEASCAGASFKTLRATSWREEALGFKPVQFQARLASRFGYPPSGGGYDDVGARCCLSP